MRFKEYFMCDSCGSHLSRSPKDLYECIDISYCPYCGDLFRERTEISDQKYTHAVISSMVISSDAFDNLLVNIENCIREYDQERLINENGQPYPLQNWKKLARDIRNENYNQMELGFLDRPEREKINGMVKNVLDRSEENNSDDQLSYQKNSDDSEDNSTVKPTKHIINDYLGICDVLFLGTSHNAPMLDKLVNEMEKNYVDIVLVESGVGQSEIDKDASIGNKASQLYDDMYDHAESHLLQGTPDNLREIVSDGGYSSFSAEEGWVDDDHQTFKDDNRMTRLIDEEYYNAIVSERDGKFAMEAVGYINNNRDINGNVCVIAGKSHIVGIYKKMTGLEL